jgi:hypothetical protein
MSTRSDEPAARLAKKIGMERVLAAANEVWIEFMGSLVWDVCESGREIFNTDDVYDLYFAVPEEDRPDTHEHRAMGPVMTRAMRGGLIKLANLPGVKSRRPSLHNSPIQQWRNLLVERKNGHAK